METVVGSTVSFHDINYTVPVKDPGAKCGQTRDKLILQGINGIFKPGMNAILGPTGSGKTSLLDVLAARKDPSGLSGQVLIDGYKQPKNFKCMSGYVVQDDVVMGTLTVRENFMFSASLRLPKDVSLEEKKKRVEETIQELGLSHCADSKVGTEFIRGVSGGERKRTNIGMELITSPDVLFLDEPTTGLDASTANAVMLLLHRLAKKGRTIIFSIHQPRYAIFRLFDSLMLLARGRTVYHGPAEEAIDFFSSVGHQIEAYNNPPDFFLDVINGDSTAVTSTLDEAETLGPDHSVIANGNGHLSKHVTMVDTKTGVIQQNGSIEMKGIMPNGTYGTYKNREINEDDAERGQVAPGEDDSALANKLAEDYARSRWNSSVKNECDAIHKEYETRGKNAKLPGETAIGYPTSFGRQLAIVSKRAGLNIIRNPQTSFVQLFVMVVFAVVCGLIYLQVDRTYPTGIQNRVGAFFFIVMNQVFGNLSAVELFIKERAIFIHENAGGFYRVSAYFLAKVFCDVIPLRAIPVFVFSLIVYFMIGLTPTAGKFFFFVLVMALAGLAAAGLGFAISATVRVFAIANLLIALCYVFMMVFSGLLVNLESIGAWLRWIQYLSIFRYALNALSINELKDGRFCLKYDNGTISSICGSFGNDYLREQGIPYETAWDLWSNVLALGLLGLVFMTLAYIQLRRVKKLK